MKPTVQQNRFNQQSPPSQRRPKPQGQYPQEKFHRPSPQKQPLAAAAPVHSPPLNPVLGQLGGSSHHDLLASAHRQPITADRQLTEQGLLAAANLPTDSSRGQVTVAPSQTPQGLTPPRKKQPMYENISRSESPASDRSVAATVIRANFNFPTQGGSSQQANQPSVEQLKRQFQPQPHPPCWPTVINGHSAERKDHLDGATLPNAAAKMMGTPGSGSRGSAVVRQQPVLYQPQPNPSASPRLQRPLKPPDMSELRY